MDDMDSCSKCQWLEKWGIDWIMRNKAICDKTLAKHLDVDIEQMSIIRERYRKMGAI